MLTNHEIGDRIYSTRLKRGLTLDEVAARVGVAKSTIQRYEKGAIDRIKLPVIESIALALNVNPNWIIGNTDDPTYSDYSCSVFRTKLIELRSSINNLSQVEFAARINVDPLLLSDWESGLKEPSLDTLALICQTFGVSADSLLFSEWSPNAGRSTSLLKLSSDESQLIEDFRDASEEIREEAAAMLHRSAERCRQDTGNTNAG